MHKRIFTTSVFSLSVALSGSAYAASYDQPGPSKVKTADFNQGGVKGKIAYPDGLSAPAPLLVLGHGFSAAPDNQIGWGQHFASYGFIAVAPELCSGLLCAPDANLAEGIVKNVIAWANGAGSPVAGMVDTTKLGLEGHSAGGQAMAVAASKLTPTAVVLFDPVAGTGPTGGSVEPGKTAMSLIKSPLLEVFAENHKGAMSCNQNGNWKPFGLSSLGPRIGGVVKDSTHCDGENNARALCGATCGGAASPVRQARYKHYATAWFLGWINGDEAARCEVTLAKMQADALIHDPGAADIPACDGAGGAGGAGAAGAGGEPGTAGTGGSSAGGSTSTGGASSTGGATSAGGATSGGGSSAAGTNQGGTGTGGNTASGGGASTEGGAPGAAPSGDAGDSGGCSLTASSTPSLGAVALSALAALATRRRRR